MTKQKANNLKMRPLGHPCRPTVLPFWVAFPVGAVSFGVEVGPPIVSGPKVQKKGTSGSKPRV